MNQNNFSHTPQDYVRMPFALAKLKGSDDFPDLFGEVSFFLARNGVIVSAHVYNLPSSQHICASPFLGFHLHEGSSCTPISGDEPFSDAQGHFNPYRCAHPSHAGDFPPLLNSSGYAYCEFLTDRLDARQIIGKTVVIHSQADDFRTQPSGDSGSRIACGVITKA